MPAEQLVSSAFAGADRRPSINWSHRLQGNTAEIAREKIREYFSGHHYSVPSVFVRYQIEPDKRGFFDKFFKRYPIFEDWVFQGSDEFHIRVDPWSRRGRTKILDLRQYLGSAECVYLHYMSGTHDAGNCLLENSSGSVRVGTFIL